MEFHELLAPPHSPIERIWFARGDGGGRETILPDGAFELVFHFGDPVLQDGVVQPRAMLAAEPRRAVTIEPTGRVDFLGVRLRCGRASAVLGAPLRELRDRTIDLRDLGIDLYECLAYATTDEARAALLVKAFRTEETDPLAEHAATAIRNRGGRLSMSRLAAACGVTARTLARAFDRSVGITPKTLARVTRLGRAAALLREGGDAATVALDAGYCDQSHLTNEFRSIAGLSPSKWVDVPDALAVRFLQEPERPVA